MLTKDAELVVAQGPMPRDTAIQWTVWAVAHGYAPEKVGWVTAVPRAENEIVFYLPPEGKQRGKFVSMVDAIAALRATLSEYPMAELPAEVAAEMKRQRDQRFL